MENETITDINTENNMNYLYMDSLERYKDLRKLIDRIQNNIDEEGIIIKKEYIKGRENLVVNPLINELNKLTETSNKMIMILIKLENHVYKDEQEKHDPLYRTLHFTE